MAHLDPSDPDRRVNIGGTGPASQHQTLLRRSLSGWQIFLLAGNGVIGIGFFVNSSYALSTSGPIGALLGILVVGVAAVCYHVSLGELVVAFPTTNAIVDIVGAFVDHELGLLVGAASWCMQSIIYASFSVSTINLVSFWNSSTGLRVGLIIIIPLALYAANSFQVRAFGNVEAVFGTVKLFIILAIFLSLCLSAAQKSVSTADAGRALSAGITHDTDVSSSTFESVSISIILAAFSYFGMETITAASFEAYEPKRDLGWPIRALTWLIPFIYIVLSLAIGAAVPWKDERLPQYSDQIFGGVMPFMGNGTFSGTLPAPVIAVMDRHDGSASAMVALLLYITLSSASATLYSASRTLHGMASQVDANHRLLGYRLIGWFGLVEHGSRVPRRAIASSALAFIWIPFLHASPYRDSYQPTSILVSMAVVSGVLIWAAQCLAYVRYHWFKSKFASELRGPEYNKFRFSFLRSHLTSLQPAIAWIGLIGSIFIAIIFGSASLGHPRQRTPKILGLYLSPMLWICSWFLLKLRRWANSRKRVKRTFQLWTHFRNAEAFKDALILLRDRVYPTEYPSHNNSQSDVLPTVVPQICELAHDTTSILTPPRVTRISQSTLSIASGMIQNDSRDLYRGKVGRSATRQVKFVEGYTAIPSESDLYDIDEKERIAITPSTIKRIRRCGEHDEAGTLRQLPTMDQLYPASQPNSESSRSVKPQVNTLANGELLVKESK